jgi:HAE1 family hydrophobic/amphiphilic exporter-1
MGATTFGAEYKTEITVKMKDGRQYEIPTITYMNQVREKIEQKYPGVEVKAMNMGLVASEEAPIEIFLSSEDPNLLMQEAKRLKSAMMDMKGAKDPVISTEESTPEIRIELDRRRMGEYGIAVATVGLQLQQALSGNDQNKLDINGKEFNINIRMDQNDAKDIEDLKKITFSTPTGNRIFLSQIAELSIDNVQGSLERKNRIPNATIRCYVEGTASGTVSAAIEKYLEENPLDKKVRMLWGGEVKRSKESMGALGTAMLIGLILVYLIMVALYDNFVYPFVVLFSILVSLVGAILALNLSSSNMGVFTMLGMLMLLGLVAKNAILIVDFTNQLKSKGKNTYDALLEAVKERMRPILMTTIAMVIGMIPIATASGSGAEWKNGLAWVLIGGLTSSMFLTIIVVPMIYYIVDRIQGKIKSKFKKWAIS